jgi:holo-[acyl-carrier protein] synthase
MRRCRGARSVAVIGIGVDVVDIERFRVSLARTPTMRERLFTPAELDYVAPMLDPVPSLAARFAAREAAMKSLGVGLGAFGFHDLWVERADSGAPSLRTTGRAAGLLVERGVQQLHLSLTHGDLVAVAYVVAE